MNAMQVVDLGLGHIRLEEAQARVLPSPGAEYGPAEGFSVLREAVASWEKVPVKEVAITTGASLGLVATLATLERPCSILCPRPYYPAYPKVAGILGLDVIYYDLEKDCGWHPNPRRINQLLREDTRALLLNFPGNPTGNLPTPTLLEEMKEILQRTNLLVISDEVYADLIYDGAVFPDMTAIYGRRIVVRLRSFSKLFGMSGERLGYVVADSNHLQVICKAHWTLAMSPPATAQVIALTALRSGPDRRVQELLKVLAKNRSRVVKILSDCDKIKFIPPTAGIFCWIEVPDCPIDSHTLVRACADKAGVVVMPGAAFGVDRPVYLRASFAVPTDEAIQGFEALARFLEHL